MASVNSVTWTWPADVLDFARENGIEQYLAPLREATYRVFPEATELHVSPARDYEDPTDRYLLWEIVTPWVDREAYRAQSRNWYQEAGKVIPNGKRLLVVTQIVSR